MGLRGQHDTFGDVFAKTDHEAFQTRFVNWVESVFRVTNYQGQVVAIAGKTLRGSHDKSIGKDAIHLVAHYSIGILVID